jgi:putative ABC transport system permease protein
LAYVVTPKFFATLGIPVLSGRSLSEQDSESAPLALVVSRKFADTYFPGENPLERTIRLQAPGSGLWKIVGVVGDLRAAGADPAPRPMMFMPHAQRPLAIMTFVIRTSSDPMNLAAATERAIWSLGRTMNVYQVRPIQQLITESYWQTRFTTVLLAGFASLALLLAAAGVYGVVSYSVAQRTREIGIRMTLGATRATVLKMVVQQGLTLTAAGVALGAVGSLALNRLLAGLLYGVTPGDPATIAGVGLGLAIVSAGACAVPAWRAAAVDPSQALHHQ